ncbi:hypothetical protein [Segeticoccus rhizosphaerae]|uniref:hypothetical protein n=1 Tax=Segeticoccus rhizosphaerae TaxID=1104777 RepID=UPI0010C15446|nr:hypothetical protein [Ornithinicoccus soli]
MTSDYGEQGFPDDPVRGIGVRPPASSAGVPPTPSVEEPPPTSGQVTDGPTVGRPLGSEQVGGGDRGTKEVASDEASDVKRHAQEGGQRVADRAKDEARNVTGEAGRQAQDLWRQTRAELTDQAGHQQQRVAGGLRELGDELGSMADRSEQNGVATDLARQGSSKAHELAGWLDGRDPGSLLEEVRGFARSKPGTFLAVAAGLGFVASRMGRGLAAEHQDQSSSGQSTSTGVPASGASAERPAYPAYPAADEAVRGGQVP